jgi:hypothetical protein
VLDSLSLVESKRCDYVKVKPDSHLKLLPTSTLGIYKVIEHIYMLSMGGHAVSALHSYTYTTWVRFGGSGSLVESQ